MSHKNDGTVFATHKTLVCSQRKRTGCNVSRIVEWYINASDTRCARCNEKMRLATKKERDEIAMDAGRAKKMSKTIKFSRNVNWNNLDYTEV